MAKKNEVIKEAVAEFILSEERTLLSEQRTALSFMRTGLATIGVGLIILRFWGDFMFRTLGIGLVLIGTYEIGQSYYKLLKYNKRFKRIKNVVKGSKWGELEYGE